MAKKGKGKSGNGRNRKDDEAKRQAEQHKLQKTLRGFVRKIMESEAVNSADIAFKAAAKEFKELFGNRKECLEEIIRRINLVRPLTCKCGHTEFTREAGEPKARCLKCKHLVSATAHCSYFRSMREPLLKLGYIWMKERCPFFSINQFKDEFRFSYSSCWLVSRKIDLILLRFSKQLKAIEDVDSKLFIECFRRRSTKTPADSEPKTEQKVADDQFYGLSKTVDLARNKKYAKCPVRVDVSHLDANLQKIYQLISDVPISFDHLVEQSSIEASDMGGYVISLELNNLIQPLTGDRFVLAGYAPNSNSSESKSPNKPLNEASKPPKFPNPSHKATADTICPLLMFLNNGFARKYLAMYVTELWRASSIVVKGKPLPIFELCAQIDDISRDDILQFECPAKIRIPAIT